jgi:dipeptidyl aminopeptidase/acylaminoacyl peptidase
VRAQLNLLCVCISVLSAVAACGAQGGLDGRAGRFGVAELLNGRFLTISLEGKVAAATVPQELYFRVSVVSPDGKRIAGYSNDGFAVVDQGFKTVWRRPDRGRNVVSLALSADGARLAVAAAGSGPNRWTDATWKLSVIESSGSEREFGSFSYNVRPEEPVAITWDPGARRLVFDDHGEIRVLDTGTSESLVVGEGLDPTWSPDGRLIAYRTQDRRIALLDFQSGRTGMRRLGMKVTSFAHWSPDSNYIFVDEDKGQPRGCFSDTRFVAYEVSTGKSQVVYDPCGRRDWSFGWVAQPDLWISAAKTLEITSRTGR